MNKYELAKLIDLAGGFNSRKRLQKTVFFLQLAGNDFHLSFRLHHYGPYSFDLAHLINDMTASGILVEDISTTETGNRYSYKLDQGALSSMHDYENTPRGQKAKRKLQKCATKIKKIVEQNLWELELGSTIAYFHQKRNDWTHAVDDACRFKNFPSDSPVTQSALRLAKALVH